jgi:hypothetical protein
VALATVVDVAAVVEEAVVDAVASATVVVVAAAVVSPPTVVASANSRARRRASTKSIAPASSRLAFHVSDLNVSMVSCGSSHDTLHHNLRPWAPAVVDDATIPGGRDFILSDGVLGKSLSYFRSPHRSLVGPGRSL